jgi:hypothetical protein
MGACCVDRCSETAPAVAFTFTRNPELRVPGQHLALAAVTFVSLVEKVRVSALAAVAAAAAAVVAPVAAVAAVAAAVDCVDVDAAAVSQCFRRGSCDKRTSVQLLAVQVSEASFVPLLHFNQYPAQPGKP